MDRRRGGSKGSVAIGDVLGPRHDASTRVQKPESMADKMAALKARVEAAIGGSKARGGLNVSLHPALEDLGQWRAGGRTTAKMSSFNIRRPEIGSASGKPERAIGHNPYIDDTTTAVGQRQPRQLIFNQKGKFIQQASALRRQAALEEMKRRIAATTRKAGIDDDLDSRQFLVVAPPAVEWWDEGLVSSYDDTEQGSARIGTEDSIVTDLVQHPVALEPPQDRLIPLPKPMFLTGSEQKKARRQRRMRDLKEQQAKQRLGLEPAPAPKVKRGNLMRVLGDAVVRDPTAVEKRVVHEMEERHQQHLQANDDRRLGKEERHTKLAANQERDAAKGIHMLVFRIGSLANGQHRYKIGANAEQHGLTGVCVMHPRFNLVVVEGGEYSIRKYRRLMTERIDWRENVPSRERDQVATGAAGRGTGPLTGPGSGADTVTGPGSGSGRDWLRAETDLGELKDLSGNECRLIFEGEVKTRAFRKWNSKVCETEAEAREVLVRAKLENLWALARGVS